MPVDEESYFCCSCHVLPRQFVGTVPKDVASEASAARDGRMSAAMGLPAGTVTFLFSDIEGSTRLLHQLGDRYGELVVQHRRVMRESAAEAGGTEIDAQGDSFFFCFTRARDAVAGALSAQRRLAAERWPDDAPVKVRMGLHTGEPTLGDEGYLGLDVVRGARIGAAAHGGQILVSETTRALLPKALPEDAQLLDLGEHTLKDMEGPERLFQLVAPGLGDTFPQPRVASPPTPSGELSSKITEYVERQLAAAFEIEREEESGAWVFRRRRKS
jgi:class 3 adenylate cyclase